jgi:hypothetical protein
MITKEKRAYKMIFLRQKGFAECGRGAFGRVRTSEQKIVRDLHRISAPDLAR